MKANELRIGNLIQSGKGFYKVFCLAGEEIIAVQDLKGVLFENNSIILKPIPLTDSWKIKLGLTWSNEKECFFIEIGCDRYLEIKENTASVFHSGSDDEVPLINILYVHKLQNLYHALTGEELDAVERMTGETYELVLNEVTRFE